MGDGNLALAQSRARYRQVQVYGKEFDPVFRENASHGGSPDLVAQGEDDIPEFGG